MEKDDQPRGTSNPSPTIIRPTNAPVVPSPSPLSPSVPVSVERPLTIENPPQPTTAAVGSPTPAEPNAVSPQHSVAQPTTSVPTTPVLPPAPTKSAHGIARHKKLYIIAASLLLVVIIGLIAWHMIGENTWKQAKIYYDKKDYVSAAKELDGVPVPSNPERLKIYSQSMLATRQLDKALIGYQKLYSITNDPAIELIIGNIYTEQKKTDEAVQTYQRVIKANPDDAQAYINLSTIYRQQGKTSEALVIVEQAISKNPTDTALLELRVTMLLDKKGSPEYRKAVDELRKLNEFDPLLQSLGE